MENYRCVCGQGGRDDDEKCGKMDRRKRDREKYPNRRGF